MSPWNGVGIPSNKLATSRNTSARQCHWLLCGCLFSLLIRRRAKLELKTRLDVPKGLGGLLKLINLRGRKGLFDDMRHAVLTQHRGQRQEHVLLNAVLTLHVDRDSVASSLVLHDGTDEGGDGQTDGPRRIALQLYDFVGAVDDLHVELIVLVRVIGCANVRVKVTQADASHVHARPNGN